MLLRNADRTIWRMFEEDYGPLRIVVQSRSSDGPDRPFEGREQFMTYCKYSYVLIHEDGPEYEKRPIGRGPQRHFPASITAITAKSVAAASLHFAYSRCRRRTITLTRRRKV
jgi:hypothetical protein